MRLVVKRDVVHGDKSHSSGCDQENMGQGRKLTRFFLLLKCGTFECLGFLVPRNSLVSLIDEVLLPSHCFRASMMCPYL